MNARNERRRLRPVFWIVLAAVAALILWGEWLEWRRRSFVRERILELEQRMAPPPEEESPRYR